MTKLISKEINNIKPLELDIWEPWESRNISINAYKPSG